MDINDTMTWRGTSKSNYYEHILLLVVASIGLAGSLFVFSECPDAEVSSVHTGAINQSAIEQDKTATLPFEDLVTIEGDMKQQQQLSFSWEARNADSRYVLDMGNGERVMLTAESFHYTYAQGGSYTLELKEISNDLISTISSTVLEIEKDNLLASGLN